MCRLIIILLIILQINFNCSKSWLKWNAELTLTFPIMLPHKTAEGMQSTSQQIVEKRHNKVSVSDVLFRLSYLNHLYTQEYTSAVILLIVDIIVDYFLLASSSKFLCISYFTVCFDCSFVKFCVNFKLPWCFNFCIILVTFK